MVRLFGPVRVWSVDLSVLTDFICIQSWRRVKDVQKADVWLASIALDATQCLMQCVRLV